MVKKVLLAMFAAYSLLAISTYLPLIWLVYKQHGAINWFVEAEKYQRDNHRYFFDGANNRGLLTICDDKVRFKEDCE